MRAGHVHVGFMTPSLEGYPPVADVARAAEERGFESLWVGEHSHLPVDSVHAYTKGGAVPEMYRRFLDPFVMLAAAAAVTSTIRLGTAVVLAAERSVLHMAKEVASLDLVSSGRLELGVGYGWNGLEAINNGVEPRHRRAVLREKVLAMKELWANGRAAYHGQHVSFTDSWTAPRPVQRPHPPVLLGAAANEVTVAHLAEFADGWIPNAAFVGDRLGQDITRIRDAAEAAGRDREAIEVTVLSTVMGSGTVEDKLAKVATRAQIDAFAELGVRRVVIGASQKDRSDLWRVLDALAPLTEHAAA